MSAHLGGEPRPRRLTRRDLKEAVTAWRYEGRGCPSEKELTAYVQGNLQLRRRLRIWWHIHAPLRGCALCRADLIDLRWTIQSEILEMPDRVRELHEAIVGRQPQPNLAASGPPADPVKRKNPKRTVARFGPVAVPGYGIAMALLAPLIFLGAGGGVTYMTIRGQERAFVKQLQSTPPVTMALSVSDQELLGISEVVREL